MYVNGQQTVIKNGVTLYEFLIEEGYDTQSVAVEKNGNIVPKKTFETEALQDDDKLEIVRFVGGG